MDTIQEIIKKLVAAFQNTTLVQRVIIIAVLLILVSGFIFTFKFSREETVSYLFPRALTIEELGTITAELDKMNYWYDTKEDKYILVKDDSSARRIRTKLAQDNKLPRGIKGWELFDMQSWTTTEFDRNVNLHRAIEGEMRRHIETLDWVEAVKVSLSFPSKPTLYTDDTKKVGAAISITPAAGYHEYLKDRKIIMGIENIVVKVIDGITHEDITITDNRGAQINDFIGDEYEVNIKRALQEEKIIEKQREKIGAKIREHLRGMIADDRYRVAVDVELNFDRTSYHQKEILPIIIKKRTPNLPYDDSIIKESIKISGKNVEEKFKGQGFIPEGPPGQEPNLPPGYKENIEKWNTYNKNENVENFVNGEKNSEHKNDAVDIVRKSVSVSVDGTWKKEVDEKGNFIFEKDRFRREYIPYPSGDLEKLALIVRGAINYNDERGDQVVVKNVPFDRVKQFMEEDKSYIRNRNIRRNIFYSAIGIIGFVIFAIVYRLILNELKRRRLEKEREANYQRQLQREEALRALEAEEAASQVETMTEEERYRVELQERAEQVALERPVDAAKVLQSWLIKD